MKRGRRWSAERWARFKAKKAAKTVNGTVNGKATVLSDVETARMEHVLVNVRSLSDAGRAYVFARLGEDN